MRESLAQNEVATLTHINVLFFLLQRHFQLALSQRIAVMGMIHRSDKPYGNSFGKGHITCCCAGFAHKDLAKINRTYGVPRTVVPNTFYNV